MEEIGGGSISSNGVVMKKEGLGFSKRGIKIENPFAFKALQVFTGFGVGCGVGIGSGAPLNLGSIPMVGEIMNSARGATNVFSGATHHVNGAVHCGSLERGTFKQVLAVELALVMVSELALQ